MKKGFTLIELLAVIVILAIIALIATPIILGIINDARKESNERSVELYASAVRNAIASYQLTNPNAPTSFSELNIEHDGNVVCATEELYADGSFYITDCIVNGVAVEYSYGEPQVTQPTRYYSWSSGTVGGDLPSDAKPTVAELNINYPMYLGLDVDDNNKVTSAYGCFLKAGIEYCLNPNEYAKSVEILKDAFKAEEENWDINNERVKFYGDTLDDEYVLVAVWNNSHIEVIDAYDNMCYINLSGDFYCSTK